MGASPPVGTLRPDVPELGRGCDRACVALEAVGSLTAQGPSQRDFVSRASLQVCHVS